MTAQNNPRNAAWVRVGRRVAALTAGAGTLVFTGAILAAGFGAGAGPAQADALCDQMRAQYGPSWPCISVPTYTPPPTMDAPTPTPGAPDTSGNGAVIGGDAGPGPGSGNGTPIVGGPASQAPARPGDAGVPSTPVPATVTPDRPAGRSPAEQTQAPARTSTLPLVVDDRGQERSSDEAFLNPASDDDGSIPLPIWALAGAAAVAAASPRTRAWLTRGGSTRATVGPSRMVLIRDESSPDTYRFAMNVPDGGTTKVNPDGSATVYDKDGNPVRQVARPWAFDAAGRPQKTWYTVDRNGDLIQHVEPAEDALYPILADPMYQCTPEDMNANGIADVDEDVSWNQSDGGTTEQAQQDAAMSKLLNPFGPESQGAGDLAPGEEQPAPGQDTPWARTEQMATGQWPEGTVVERGTEDCGVERFRTGQSPDGTVTEQPVTGINNTQDGFEYQFGDGTSQIGQQEYEAPPSTATPENIISDQVDPSTGNRIVISEGEYGSTVAELFAPDGTKLIREERYDGGVLDTGVSAGTTIRQYDYRTGRELIRNYDANGKLYNSSYMDDSVNVLLNPDGSLSATLIDSDADYDWQRIAEAVPQEFANAGDAQKIVLNKENEQLTIYPDGSSMLADYDTDRALHFAPGENQPDAVFHADGSDLGVTDGLHDFAEGVWDGGRSLVGLGPYGTWESWKGLGSGLGTIVMYLPLTMSDAIHTGANSGRPTQHQRPDRESELVEAVIGINPAYVVTSPAYATGMLAGVGLTSLVPGAGEAGTALTRALRSGERVRARRPLVENAIAPALENHGYSINDFQELMVRPTRPLTPEEIKGLPAGTPVPRPLNRSELAVVDSARMAIAPLTPDTPIQKALDPKGKQLENILTNHTADPKKFPLDGVGGAVAALDDVRALLTPSDLMNGLALNYPGSGHKLDEAFAIRFVSPSIGKVPNGPLVNEMLTPGGLHAGEGFTPDGKTLYPFTGHGFTASLSHIIPEYELSNARMNPGAMVVRIAEDGTETVIRVLTEARRWIKP